MTKKILVTGATGLVGYHITQALLRRHLPVKLLVREPKRAEYLAQLGCEIVMGDVTDRTSIQAALQDCDTVYHAAGIPEQWLKNENQFFTVNVDGTINMVEASLRAAIQRFIYTSTIDVFKANVHSVFDETALAEEDKHTAYERSKQQADRYVEEALQCDLPAIFLHPAAVYGAGPSRSLGVNGFLQRLIDGKIPFLLPGGMPVVLAHDVGEGHVLAGLHGKIGERYILSESYQTIVAIAQQALTHIERKRLPPVAPLTLVQAFAWLNEKWAHLTGMPPLIAQGQLHFLQWQAIPNSEKAQQELNWQPCDFQQGLVQTIQALLQTQK
ncbi:MAG: SDR family NAD(P)-dependent oxidoreductase [Legionellales bacterium]|nr:SDR family NAD(P)-dependent oxidoreductase [Legionellales bacterium]